MSSEQTAAAFSASPCSSAAMKTFAASSGVTSSLSRRGVGAALDPFRPHPDAERGDRERRDDAGGGQAGVVPRAEGQLKVALLADGQREGGSARLDGEVAATENERKGARCDERL